MSSLVAASRQVKSCSTCYEFSCEFARQEHDLCPTCSEIARLLFNICTSLYVFCSTCPRYCCELWRVVAILCAVLYFRISTPDHSNHSTSALDIPAKRKIVPKVFSSLDPGPDPVPPAGSPSSVSVSSVLYQMENCEIVFSSIFFHLGQKFNVSEALGR